MSRKGAKDAKGEPKKNKKNRFSWRLVDWYQQMLVA